MQVHRTVAVASAVAIGAAGALAGIPSASLAASSDRAVRVVAAGLDNPFGLQNAKGHGGGLLVAQGASGKITRIFPDGRKRTILNGVPGVTGVAGGPHRVFAVTGEGAPRGGDVGPSRVVRMRYDGGRPTVIANLLRHELKHNPDRQVQFVDGKPVDAISNPFAMTWSRFGLFVADGGANDVLKVNPRTGKVRTFFAPRTFKDTEACRNAENNPGTRGCDPVATGVVVRGRSVFVTFLGAHQPGAGRLYKLHARTGEVQRIWKGLTAPTGVAVRGNGTKYVSHVEEGLPPGQPEPGFDPSTVGEITRIMQGERTHAQVTMPTGLTLRHGRLYSTAWSIADFLGMKNAGQVVRVKARAFR